MKRTVANLTGRSIAALVAWLFVLAAVPTASAHMPHDVVRVAAVSPNFVVDETLFIVVRHNLMRSTDGGMTWKKLVRGLDNLQPYSSLAIAASSGKTPILFLSTSGDGVYRSDDSGTSWRQINDGLGELNIGLVATPAKAQGGHAWAAGSNRGLFRYSSEQNAWTEVDIGPLRVTAISFDPADDKRIVAGDDEGGLHLSEDGGATWRHDTRLAEYGAVTALTHTPAVAGKSSLYVATVNGRILKAGNGGGDVVDVSPADLSGPTITSIAVSPNFERDGLILATTAEGDVVRSTDGGQSWETANGDVPIEPSADRYGKPHFSLVTFAETFGSDQTLFVGGFNGLFKSLDSGVSWTELETLRARLLVGMDLSPAFAEDGTVALSTYGGGIYLSQDRGESWQAASSGLVNPRYHDIQFSPAYASDSTLLAVTDPMRVSKSTDGGKSWSTVRLVEKRPVKTAVNDVIRWISPELRNWVGEQWSRLRYQFSSSSSSGYSLRPGVIAFSPAFESDRTIFLTSIEGVFKSTDAGETSETLWTEIKVRSLVVSPTYDSDQTVFVSVDGEDAGVYKSVDGGETWLPAADGIEADQIHLAISPAYETDQTLFAGAARGLYKSMDGGSYWQDLSDALPWPRPIVEAVALSPDFANDRQAMVAVKGRGLLRTSDGGASFEEVGRDLICNNHGPTRMHGMQDEFRFIFYSPTYAQDSTIFLSTGEEVFRSFDSGESWQPSARPVRYENTRRNVVDYEGDWGQSFAETFSASSSSGSDVAGSKVTLTFSGTGVSLIGSKAKDLGIAKIYLDGEDTATVDQYAPSEESGVPLFSVSDLPDGRHTLSVEVTGTQNEAASGHRILFDAFDVVPGETESHCR